MCMFCDFMEVELDSKKNGKLSFHKGSCHFFHQARCKFGNTFKLCHTPFDWRFYFFCARNFERQKNRKNKLQNFLWTLIFRQFFEKHPKSFFFVLQVIEQNDNFWTLKHGVLFFLCFFKSFISYNTFLNKQSHLELSN